MLSDWYSVFVLFHCCCRENVMVVMTDCPYSIIPDFCCGEHWHCSLLRVTSVWPSIKWLAGPWAVLCGQQPASQPMAWPQPASPAGPMAQPNLFIVFTWSIHFYIQCCCYCVFIVLMCLCVFYWLFFSIVAFVYLLKFYYIVYYSISRIPLLFILGIVIWLHSLPSTYLLCAWPHIVGIYLIYLLFITVIPIPWWSLTVVPTARAWWLFCCCCSVHSSVLCLL